MRSLIKIVCTLGLLFVTTSALSQIKKTDVNTDVDLVKVYEQVIKEGYPTLEIYKELATAQYFRSNYEEAKKWFEKWFEMEEPKDKTVRHRYKQTLRALNLPTKSNKYLADSATEN